MSITALADRRVTVKRRTSLVLDPSTAVAVMAATRQPARESCIEVNALAAGTVTVAGTVNGAPGSEVLTFAGADVLCTKKVFTALDPAAFTITGAIVGTSLRAEAVGRDGSRTHSAYTVVSAWPMRMDRGPATWPAGPEGSTEREPTRFYFDFTTVWEPRDGDVFVDDRTLDEWFVRGVPNQHGGGLTVPHHWEVRVQQNQGRAST